MASKYNEHQKIIAFSIGITALMVIILAVYEKQKTMAITKVKPTLPNYFKAPIVNINSQTIPSKNTAAPSLAPTGQIDA